jgi:hypothetical protein
MFSISSCIFWPFSLIPLKNLFGSFLHLFTGSLILGSLVFFLALCIFCLLVPCQI